MSETIRITVANYAALPAASTMLNGRAKTLDDDAVYVSRRVNGSVVWLDSDDPLAQEFGSGGSGGAGASIIQVATVELTDEQIKATSVLYDIVDSPGVGKAAIPIMAFIRANIIDGYSGIDADAFIEFSPTVLSYLPNDEAESLTEVTAMLATSGERLWTVFPISNYFASWTSSFDNTTLDQRENLAIQLTINNELNFTGGNAANTLKVTVLYYVLDVS